jgi:hypothetical protein
MKINIDNAKLLPIENYSLIIFSEVKESLESDYFHNEILNKFEKNLGDKKLFTDLLLNL